MVEEHSLRGPFALAVDANANLDSNCTIYLRFRLRSTHFQALNLILLTSSELSELRVLLKQSLVNNAGKDLFDALYLSWCHSAMAIISLCFLAQVTREMYYYRYL